jgi:hypothetical protein
MASAQGGVGRIMAIRPNTKVEKFKYWLRGLLGPYPLYIRFLRWRHGADKGIVGPDTEIVIESYPRSGNTFSVTAFEMAQGRQPPRADHLHAPAQVVLAARMRIPCLVLIRKPEDAILSHAIRFPYISIRQCLTDYVRFYKTVLPYRGSYLLVRFESATRDFGAVIVALNQKFGTSFAVFDHTPENEKECFAIVQRRYEERFGDGRSISEAIHSRPSAEKAKMTESTRKAFTIEFNSQELTSLRQEAIRLYQTLSATADL